MTRNLTCIICPRGCALTADIFQDTVSVTGNACPKGAEYAQNECLNPVRTVTTTLRISNRCDTMVSVKTEKPVPKDQTVSLVAQLRKITVEAPVCVGDVAAQLGDIRIIVTKAVL